MSKANRSRMKRQLVSSYNHLENSFKGIIYLHELFENVHPELAEGLIIAAELAAQAQEVLEAFAMQSWNMNKGSFNSYKQK